MIRTARPTPLVLAALMAGLATASAPAAAQDVRGIEACSQESKMERRTGCLQSNVEYLQHLIARNNAATQQRLAAATAEIAALKASVAALQAAVGRLQVAAPKDPAAARPPDTKAADEKAATPR